MTRADGSPTGRGIPMTAVLSVNAVVALVLGVVLLAATWTGLFTHLSKFRPVPWIYPQLAGAGLMVPATLMARLGLEALINSTLRLVGRVGGALPGRKVLTLTATTPAPMPAVGGQPGRGGAPINLAWPPRRRWPSVARRRPR